MQRKKLIIPFLVTGCLQIKGKDCMEKFCKDLREDTMIIINHEKKEMITLINEENEFYEIQNVCYICK